MPWNFNKQALEEGRLCAFPIHTLAHARAALACADAPGNEDLREQIREAVFQRWPDLQPKVIEPRNAHTLP